MCMYIYSKLYLNKESYPVPVICNSYPDRDAYKVSKEQVEMRVILMLPAEGEEVVNNFTAHVHHDGVHSCWVRGERGGRRQ